MKFLVGRIIVVTHGFLKKTPRIPEREIARAHTCMDEFLRLNPEAQ